jgi:hypothetical protein
MGPCEDPSTPPENQDTRDTRPLRTEGCAHRAHRPRSRSCLLKGCEGVFRPQQPLARYCGEVCLEKARQWQAWKARRRYRQSTNGKQKRQAQSRRYRERCKATPERKTVPVGQGEGHPYRPYKIFLCSCDRPGCYAEFHRSQRSPLQRFCSRACRRAVERVLEREQRWRKRPPEAPETGARGEERNGPRTHKDLPISSGHIAVTAATSVISTCEQKRGRGSEVPPRGRSIQ